MDDDIVTLPDLAKIILDVGTYVYADSDSWRTQMAKDLGISRGSIDQWTEGRRSPFRAALGQLREKTVQQQELLDRLIRRIDEADQALVCPCGKDFHVLHKPQGGEPFLLQCLDPHYFHRLPGPPFGPAGTHRFKRGDALGIRDSKPGHPR